MKRVVRDTEKRILERKYYQAAAKHLAHCVYSLRIYEECVSVKPYKGVPAIVFESLEALLAYLADQYTNELCKASSSINCSREEAYTAVGRALGTELLQSLGKVNWLEV